MKEKPTIFSEYAYVPEIHPATYAAIPGLLWKILDTSISKQEQKKFIELIDTLSLRLKAGRLVVGLTQYLSQHGDEMPMWVIANNAVLAYLTETTEKETLIKQAIADAWSPSGEAEGKPVALSINPVTFAELVTKEGIESVVAGVAKTIEVLVEAQFLANGKVTKN